MDDFAAWLHQYAWAVWGVSGFALAAVELFTLDLTLLMLATGAFAGAVTALLLPSQLWVQLVVALAVTVSALLLLRPRLLWRVREVPGHRSTIESLIGSGGRVTTRIGREGGEVEVRGQVWDARAFDPTVTISEGLYIEVYGIDGITLIVHPVESAGEHESP